MAAQNALVELGQAQDEAEIAEVLLAHIPLTEASPGGPWIMRMRRAVPQLAEGRLASHRALTAEVVARALAADPAQDRAVLERRARLAVDLGYCAIELVFDEPELDPRA
ncbi:MAG: hypothetical protein ACK44Y_15660, partial [Novosphingobium sp.]